MSFGAPAIGSLATSMLDQAGTIGKPDAVAKPEGMGGFGEVLRGKLDQLEQTQGAGASAANDLATGRVDDIAQTMMRVEQANVSLQLATQVRNKAIEAYQEILRMQI